VSLRGRLTLLCAVAVGVTVVLASAVSFLAVRHELRHQVDETLVTEATRLAPLAERLRLAGRGFPIPPLPARTGASINYVQLISPNGQGEPIRGDVSLPLTASDRAVAAGSADQAFADRNVGGLHLRVLTIALPGGGAVQLARPLAAADSVLHRLRLVLALLILGATALAAGLGRAFAYRVLAPVGDLTAAAEHIETTGDLGRRIPAPGGDEVGRLARRFNSMLDRLGATQSALADSAEQQRRLIADASHELRTPITSLRTNLEVLREGGTLPDAERRALLEDLVSQAEELGALVADLIELARDGESPQAREAVRIDELVEEAVARARRHAPEARFATALEPWTAEVAPDRLARAVNNLLDNAVRHGARAGRVEIGVREGEITVRDHGEGVPAADLAHVFDRFYRGAAARGRPGSGLGLAIVRQVAEAHGGTVSVEQAPGGGALFRLLIPVNAREEATQRGSSDG
jgi:two-component system sensor histidine kinase MprB